MANYYIFEASDTELLNKALYIRQEVFVQEQGVPLNIEVDGQDQQRLHILGCLDGQAIATARFYLNEEQAVKIQRVAVLKDYRGRHHGRDLLLAIESWARSQKHSHLVLSSQDSAIAFYESVGFNLVDRPGYLDAGILHHDMIKII